VLLCSAPTAPSIRLPAQHERPLAHVRWGVDGRRRLHACRVSPPGPLSVSVSVSVSLSLSLSLSLPLFLSLWVWTVPSVDSSAREEVS
jgi:hypothetical protein